MPGWYADAANTVRWWDGRGWTHHVQPAGPQHLPVQPFALPLQQQPVFVNTSRPVRFYKTSHGFHLIMSVVTLGLWLPVWAIMAIANSTRSN
jgi:hypothetical protein